MKHDNITTWCLVATARIRFRPDRQAVYDELHAHLEDHRDALIEQGMDENEATQKALESMGSATQIAPQLAAIHKPFWGYLLRVSQILLVILLVLSIIPLWDYATDLNIYDKPNQYHSFEVFDETSYGGDTGRTLHHLSKPDASFSTDGSTFTLTDAVVYTEYSEYFDRDRTYLYVLIHQRSLLPWSEHDEYFSSFPITGWFSARDSLGNHYEGFMDQSTPDASCLITGGAQTGIFTYTHECWINDFPKDAEWVDICYEREGRSYVLRIDLTGGGSE